MSSYTDQELKEVGTLVVEEMRKNHMLTISQVARNIGKPLDAVKDAIMTHLPTIKGESNMTTETVPRQFVPGDIPEIVAEVRRLANEYPDFVYSLPHAAGTCDNVTGGDPKYPDLKGCIIGQAVRNLGFWIPECCRVWTVDQLLSRLHDANWQPKQGVAHQDIRGLLLGWLTVVQSAQDEGVSWSEAVQAADRWEPEE